MFSVHLKDRRSSSTDDAGVGLHIRDRDGFLRFHCVRGHPLSPSVGTLPVSEIPTLILALLCRAEKTVGNVHFAFDNETNWRDLVFVSFPDDEGAKDYSSIGVSWAALIAALQQFISRAPLMDLLGKCAITIEGIELNFGVPFVQFTDRRNRTVDSPETGVYVARIGDQVLFFRVRGHPLSPSVGTLPVSEIPTLIAALAERNEVTMGSVRFYFERHHNWEDLAFISFLNDKPGPGAGMDRYNLIATLAGFVYQTPVASNVTSLLELLKK